MCFVYVWKERWSERLFVGLYTRGDCVLEEGKREGRVNSSGMDLKITEWPIVVWKLRLKRKKPWWPKSKKKQPKLTNIDHGCLICVFRVTRSPRFFSVCPALYGKEKQVVYYFMIIRGLFRIDTFSWII